MLSRGDTVVYKCRGIYKVEEIGTLDFSFADRSIILFSLWTIRETGHMFRQTMKRISESRSADRKRWN